MSSKFSYPELCVMVLRNEIHNSFTFAYGFDIRKIIYAFQVSFSMVKSEWHVSSKFVYPKLYNLTYGYKYPEDKFFKSLKTKQTFHVNVLSVCLNWYDVGKISHYNVTTFKNEQYFFFFLHYKTLKLVYKHTNIKVY